MIASTTKEIQDKIGDINAPGLRSNVLTPYGKRWQLWGKGIRGVDADKIIEELYGVDVVSA